MLHYLKLAGLFFRLGAITELQYRVNFLVQVFQSLMGLVTALGGLAIIFGHTDTVRGWRPAELVVVVGVYFLVGGVINLVIQPSLQRFMEDVRLGTLDFTLVKPVDSQVMVSVRQVQLWKLVDIGLGLALLGVATAQIGADVGAAQAAALAVALACGMAIVYSFWLILATCAFWFVRVENILVIFQSMYEAGRWPVSIYPGWLRFALTFLVPVAFAVTVPAEAMVGRLTGLTLLGAVALAAVMLTASRRFWRFGVRHYSGASA